MMSTVPIHSNSKLCMEAIVGNEDLLTQILLFIPIKPLLTFKSVSKAWLSLISSRTFSHLYTLRNPTSVVSGLFLRRTPTEFRLLYTNSTRSSKPLFYSLDFPAGTKILQSCNGLLLCSTFRKVGTKPTYYVFNPTTNNFFTLPPFTHQEGKTAVFGVNLAFEPSNSPYYKVVCVRSTHLSFYYYQVEIFESQFGAWRLSGSPFVAPFDMVFDHGVFWNDAVHWISPRGASFYFDLSTKCLKNMPSLPVLGNWGKRRFRYLWECCGHLHLIEIYGPRATNLKVFEMERDYSNWFVKYRIDLDPILTAYPTMVRSFLDLSDSNYYAFVPLYLVRDQNGVDACLLLHIPGKVISYNVRDKSFKQLFELVPSDDDDAKTKKISLQFGWLDAYPFMETLAPVC